MSRQWCPASPHQAPRGSSAAHDQPAVWSRAPPGAACRESPRKAIRLQSVLLSAKTALTGRLRFAVGVFTAVQLLLLVWWLAFFPGLGNYDSVQYSWEALTSNWATDHSV